MSKTLEDIKIELFKACEDFVLQKQQNIESIIASHKNSLASETKSSAGDKHETGRAMLQLEMEKAGQQLAEVHKMKATLDRINLQNNSEKAALGSIIRTEQFNYFLAISIGKVVIEKEEYFVVSTNSPIGKQLLGIEKGATIPMNKSEVLEVM